MCVNSRGRCPSAWLRSMYCLCPGHRCDPWRRRVGACVFCWQVDDGTHIDANRCPEDHALIAHACYTCYCIQDREVPGIKPRCCGESLFRTNRGLHVANLHPNDQALPRRARSQCHAASAACALAPPEAVGLSPLALSRRILGQSSISRRHKEPKDRGPGVASTPAVYITKLLLGEGETTRAVMVTSV